ncbi:PREDICTED: uncharacterized protein LOC109219393 [Nicotiana attenuata]|uniref:uncharacterized protein LOC109219393 n=1 Tax=Nicotiana attenuata TaxID=49451 RepID=UPI000904B9EB|nr:PREDICTED: uncharacterized protein LOC109219393 [Nicotiana attenuata]
MVSQTEQLMHDYQIEVDNWKEQYDSLQLEMEVLEENKCTLEQQLKIVTSELAVEKASSNQASKDKDFVESSFAEQLSKASEEIRCLNALLNEKDVYAGELVQTLTQTQDDLRVSSDKVKFLESSLAPLQSSYDAALAEREEFKSEIDQWERDYEALKDKDVVEVSWAILNTRHDTLVEASQEGFNLDAELAKIKETIEKTQQGQSFSSPMSNTPELVEADPNAIDIPAPSDQVEASVANDAILNPSPTPQ